MPWNKKEVAPEVVRDLNKKFSCDLLFASILARRGITRPGDVLYYLEDDLRFQHSPFLLSEMEDAVDRIWQAKDEGEKVLVFGDRDVDGVTSTALVVTALIDMGIDVAWRLPSGDEAYGLSLDAVEDFAAKYGTLIITVDCGISNNAEVARAAELGVDVIVVDHHNPPEVLPEPAIIINPKLQDSGYPFPDISGCAVAYKLVSALRFSRHELYKQELCLLNVRPLTDAYAIECLKVVNMTARESLTETVVPGAVRVSQTRLVPFLQGQQIMVWDADLQKKQLEKVFGKGVDFNVLDLRPEIEKLIPQAAGMSLLKLKDMSRLARYRDEPATEIEGFFNLFVTFAHKKTEQAFPDAAKREQHDLQLTALAALADIMPLQNENRLFVRQGLASINSGNVRPGLLELLARQDLLGKRLTSKDLSWSVIPVLNAAGRLGQPELALKLFLESDAKMRDAIARRIAELNEDRKRLGDEAWALVESPAYKSLADYGGLLAAVMDKGIHRGITGLVAGKLAQTHKVPAIVVTFLENGPAVGSMRSLRGVDATRFLDQIDPMGDLFLNHGGHNAAAGFSFPQEKTAEFTARLKEQASLIELESPEDESVAVDAELPHTYLTPDTMKLVDRFEPFGKDNEELRFLVSSAVIVDADVIGKVEKKHLKLTLQCGALKWPARYWNAAERYNRDFTSGDKVNVVFSLARNAFNGTETVQLIVADMEKAG
ncbi:MAG: single-stranded-DNA-specific exonuclease RecJ [Treponema sp.]|jgi:single-stranded-DNA-specific exonuclease|nr:single-stranded-DNA-specific exonuclease RecJ [Treponema sp.]